LQIETNKNTALTLACFQGRYEVVSLLVDRKANIEHRAKVTMTLSVFFTAITNNGRSVKKNYQLSLKVSKYFH